MHGGGDNDAHLTYSPTPSRTCKYVRLDGKGEMRVQTELVLLISRSWLGGQGWGLFLDYLGRSHESPESLKVEEAS